MQAFSYLIPEELFKMELEEGVERVQITISVLSTFKQLFHTYQQQIPKYYKNSQSVKLWDFPASLVFQRSDRIMERLMMIEVRELTHNCGEKKNGKLLTLLSLKLSSVICRKYLLQHWTF